MTSDTTTRTPSRADAALIGTALTAVGLAVIWGTRLTVDRALYVSELGADGEPTAGWFRAALLLVVAGGASIAWATRGLRATAPVLRAWSASTSIGVAAALFFLASQVPCTAGCPLPVGASFTWQDLVHTASAVLAFAAACVGMLQAALADGDRGVRVLSSAAGISVALVAGTGGLLSPAGRATDLGGALELVATTIALLWLAMLGVATCRRIATRERAPRRHGDARIAA